MQILVFDNLLSGAKIRIYFDLSINSSMQNHCKNTLNTWNFNAFFQISRIISTDKVRGVTNIRKLFNFPRKAGSYMVIWSYSHLSSRISQNSAHVSMTTETRKMFSIPEVSTRSVIRQKRNCVETNRPESGVFCDRFR